MKDVATRLWAHFGGCVALFAAGFLLAFVAPISSASGAMFNYDSPAQVVALAHDAAPTGPSTTHSGLGTHAVATTTNGASLTAATAPGVVYAAAAGFRATKGEAELLAKARAARDAKAAEVGSSKATVTGGYDAATGRVVAGCNRNPVGCAEDDVARQLGIPPDGIRFTEAVRPRTGKQVPVCRTCQGKYERSQFPPGTKFDEP